MAGEVRRTTKYVHFYLDSHRRQEGARKCPKAAMRRLKKSRAEIAASGHVHWEEGHCHAPQNIHTDASPGCRRNGCGPREQSNGPEPEQFRRGCRFAKV